MPFWKFWIYSIVVSYVLYVISFRLAKSNQLPDEFGAKTLFVLMLIPFFNIGTAAVLIISDFWMLFKKVSFKKFFFIKDENSK